LADWFNIYSTIMAILLDRDYYLYEMASFADQFEPSITQYFYAFTGTVPSWVTATALPSPYTAFNFPQFNIDIPEGTTGSFTFGVTQTGILSGATQTGTINITASALVNQPINLPHCQNVNIGWLKPSGGWANFIFNGKTQAEQVKGDADTFINSIGEKKYSRRDGVHQGLIVTTGKVSPMSADYIGDLFKAIQAYLWDDSGFVPIMIDPRTFRRVRSGDSFSEYEFAFVYAVEDVIQTQ
jgi:hypothetical protein